MFFTFPIAPTRQFRYLVIAVFLALLCTIAFHTYFFYVVESQGIFQNDQVATTGPKVNDKKLTSVLSRYDKKNSVRTAALQIAPAVSDPEK